MVQVSSQNWAPQKKHIDSDALSLSSHSHHHGHLTGSPPITYNQSLGERTSVVQLLFEFFSIEEGPE